MIPSADGLRIGRDVTVVQTKDQPSRTYAIDFESGRVVGHVDGLEAVKQAVMKILRTERFHHLIYSWNYGIELNGVFGKSFPVAESEIRRAIKEALLQDGRIADVRDITVTQGGRRQAHVAFTVVTALGDIKIEEAVTEHV